jgi:alkaline phosphatase
MTDYRCRLTTRGVSVSLLFSFILLSGAATGMAAPSFTPLPLTAAANTGFSDAQADDRTGGWTDQGGNDLRALKPGKLTAAGVPFEILDERAAGSKACIVLGGPTRKYLPSKATVPVPDLQGQYLYLLHAAAWCPPAKAQKMTGVLFIDYADGTSAEAHVRFGRDVGDWTSPDSFKNAARAWTVYNGNTQVSLFASRFKLKPLTVKALRLESRDSTWMVAAASIGDETALKPLKPDLTLTKQYASPPSLTAPLSAMPDAPAPKNIILIIGDGMGPGALQLTSLYQHKAEGRLVMEQLPVASLCTTLSLSNNVTDSAAASTAIATGRKTDNGSIGLTPDNRRLVSFPEVAHREGRAVGLITSDALTGATPAGFYAHVDTRGSYQGVADFAAACGYEVLIGNTNGRAWFMPKAQGGQRTDARRLLEEMSASGYALVSDAATFAQAPADKRVLGFMDSKTVLGTEQILAQLTETALARLAKNDKGFFLMVECTITDGGGHGNKPDLTVLGTLQVDWAVRSAVEFARTRGDTLVLVTADHETGGLSSSVTNNPPGKLVIDYATTSHTRTPVRLFAYGPGSRLLSGTVDNTDIAKTVCRLWNITLPPPAKSDSNVSP